MQTATIFNIQKFSLNDGPGIRTVVFFKGCPLRCFWCSNPESQSRLPQLEWNEKNCIACGLCIQHLPHAGISTTAGKTHVNIVNVRGDSPEAQAAIKACPGKALTCAGKTYTTDEVLELCLQDELFYQDSGGGVTLSGGEAMTWPDFCIELLEKLHSHGIDTCIETEAFVSQETFASIARHLDHMLIDLKHWDSTKHALGTGGGNELVLSNIKTAIDMGVGVLVRTPVIPGFNDSLEDARGMASALNKLGAKRVQLLPFHNFGENKYALLEKDYALAGVPNMHAEDLAAYAQQYSDLGVEAFF
ncbi:glycyl-radical enzyme activating protein [Atopobium fossor]|uniref:glycyl-radical enzyme activating protein n=1 Tax=Atopobium fossor TaxID=39487 RepID=UPI00040FC3D5|nr:glycyl-radical enzyme activating protein [Atopobium fossor]